MIQIFICDDEPLALAWIQANVKNSFPEKESKITVFSSGTEMRKRIVNGMHADVLFLDINMPDIDGIVLGRHLRTFLPELLIIFVSSKEEAVFDSFTAEPFRFLRKSQVETEMPRIASDVKRALSRLEQRIVIRDRQNEIHLNPNRIVYIESAGKNQMIHYGEKLITVNIRLKELETMCVPYGFLKPHGSYLVNYRFISAIGTNEILLDNSEKIPVSRGRVNQFRKEYLGRITENIRKELE